MRSVNKGITIIGWLALCLAPNLGFAEGGNDKGKEQPPSEQTGKFSYVLGWRMASELENLPMKLDSKALVQAIEDRMQGKKPQYDQAEMEKIRNDMMTAFQKEKGRQLEELGAKNRAAGQAFLAENGKKTGIVTTASGLQYQVVREGKGDKPKATDQVTVHYTGTLLDGSEFDSSVKRGQPVTFPLDKVIPGWTEGLQLMQPGGKYKLFIPPQLAYGNMGSGNKIGPEATLIFDVELLEVKPGKGGS
ncbi:MAG: FKBP-type peptidyl-prolyl cis-trans isomerase [Magnetococcales bacterium]|nr:FKBP-type peptidyl-prolyl cis-trans isomerase [Magnetococcales bacterium]